MQMAYALNRDRLVGQPCGDIPMSGCHGAGPQRALDGEKPGRAEARDVDPVRHFLGFSRRFADIFNLLPEPRVERIDRNPDGSPDSYAGNLAGLYQGISFRPPQTEQLRCFSHFDQDFCVFRVHIDLLSHEYRP
jgi:hypothetical protein